MKRAHHRNSVRTLSSSQGFNKSPRVGACATWMCVGINERCDEQFYHGDQRYFVSLTRLCPNAISIPLISREWIQRVSASAEGYSESSKTDCRHTRKHVHQLSMSRPT